MATKKKDKYGGKYPKWVTGQRKLTRKEAEKIARQAIDNGVQTKQNYWGFPHFIQNCILMGACYGEMVRVTCLNIHSVYTVLNNGNRDWLEWLSEITQNMYVREVERVRSDKPNNEIAKKYNWVVDPGAVQDDYWWWSRKKNYELACKIFNDHVPKPVEEWGDSALMHLVRIIAALKYNLVDYYGYSKPNTPIPHYIRMKAPRFSDDFYEVD